MILENKKNEIYKKKKSGIKGINLEKCKQMLSNNTNNVSNSEMKLLAHSVTLCGTTLRGRRRILLVRQVSCIVLLEAKSACSDLKAPEWQQYEGRSYLTNMSGF